MNTGQIWHYRGFQSPPSALLRVGITSIFQCLCTSETGLQSARDASADGSTVFQPGWDRPHGPRDSQGGRAQRWKCSCPSFCFCHPESLQLFFLTGWAVLSSDCFLKVQEGEAESFKPPKNGRICVTLKQTSGSSCLELRICSV